MLFTLHFILLLGKAATAAWTRCCPKRVRAYHQDEAGEDYS
jgi:hypothetical protein